MTMTNKKKEGALEQKLKGIDLTLKDVVEVIADGYKIESMRFVGNEINGTELLGLHIDDGVSKEILINSEQPIDEKRYTILHELYHALFRRLGLKQDERDVDYLARKKFRELYYNLNK